ncbi:Serine/threonine-protein phosphatase 4 regulatory subunit 3 [Nymphaea thermarum]|nr:Serine/threonine-protein phosphatase 4 regulatory subunit 3 [Nymphaea thermarum]
MGAQGKAPPMAESMQVYRLNEEGKWDDRGTGHVSVDYLERSEELGLFVVDEDDNETLLVHRILSDEIYRKQEDTIISWRDPELLTELALSFQESMGCSDQICSVQRNMQFSSLSSLEVGTCPTKDNLENSSGSHINDEAFHSLGSELRELPPIELSNLPSLLKIIVEGCAADQIHVTELILQDKDFLWKLVDLFRMCEDLDNIEELHLIFKLIKGINDPEASKRQRHRVFLKEHVVFKEAIPIESSTVLFKIHQTYRIGYIKDVILPRALDEAVVANLNSMIHSNNTMVSFLYEFCSLGKSLQLVQQARLFRDLVNEGVFDIIADILQSHDKALVLTGTDILLIFLNHDPNLLRTYVAQQEMFLGLLVRGMTTDFGEDMHCQFLEIFRILLDSYTLAPPQQKVAILDLFYERHMDHLIHVVVSSCPQKGAAHSVGTSAGFDAQVVVRPEILLNICELLCFCVHHHPYRIKCNFLHNNAIEKVMSLIRRREKYLVVAAVRFLRAVMSHNDDTLLRHIVKNGILRPVVDVFVANGSRYNLLNSAIIELFDHIRKASLKPLITYTVECLWDQLDKFEYIETFRSLKLKYEQSLENYQTKGPKGNAVDPRKRMDERALEKEEEDYFNEDSDEEDSASAHVSSARSQPTPILANGMSTSYSSSRAGLIGLVDYEDDEEEDDDVPPRRGDKPEVSTICDGAADSPTKRKLSVRINSKDEELDSTKKKRLDRSSDGYTVTDPSACQLCNPVESPRRQTVSADSHEPAVKSAHSEESPGETAGTVPRGCSNCMSSTSSTRQSNGEDSSVSPISNSASELAVNGAKVTSSEPFPVR